MQDDLVLMFDALWYNWSLTVFFDIYMWFFDIQYIQDGVFVTCNILKYHTVSLIFLHIQLNMVLGILHYVYLPNMISLFHAVGKLSSCHLIRTGIA